MRYKVLFGTSEAGGADCLMPVINRLKKHKHDLFTMAGRNAARVFANNEFLPDKKIITGDCSASCRSMLEKFRPDAIVTGLLGEKNNIDYSLIKAGKEYSIPVLSILDSWMNYADRLHDPVTDDRLGFLPDKIAVMDRIALAEMVSEGVPEDRCYITGHPKFDSLRDIRKKRDTESYRDRLRKKYGIGPKDIAIVFYAHPVSNFYPDKYLGYDERDVLPVFFDAIKSLRSEICLKAVFKEHPRGRSAFLNKKDAKGVVFTSRANADDLLIISDFAVSMTSTLLIFSAALGIPVFSIQPNLVPGRDLNVLTRKAGYPIITCAQQLYLCIRREIASGFMRPAPDWLLSDGNACRRIDTLISDLVNKEGKMDKKLHHPFLIGEKCYLRGLELADLNGDYFQWFNDQDITRFMKNGSFPNSEARMRAFFDKMTISENDIVLAIIDRKGDRHIGNLGLHNIDWFYRKAELGIILGEKDSHGKGFAAEAMRLLLDHAFSRLNLHKVYLRTEQENIAAIRLFERVGFKKEGLIREECFRAGKFTNSVYMGCLAHELNSK